MTNEQIIFNASIALMNEGKIKGTGQFVTVELENGSTGTLEIPEPLHTFATWKNYGRQIRKGEKCRARIDIWKHGKPKKVIDEETGEEVEKVGRMFMKTAYFFTYEQTEPIKN